MLFSQADAEREAAYFSVLEKKELYEEKMRNITEQKVTVVCCKVVSIHYAFINSFTYWWLQLKSENISQSKDLLLYSIYYENERGMYNLLWWYKKIYFILHVGYNWVC